MVTAAKNIPTEEYTSRKTCLKWVPGAWGYNWATLPPGGGGYKYGVLTLQFGGWATGRQSATIQKEKKKLNVRPLNTRLSGIALAVEKY